MATRKECERAVAFFEFPGFRAIGVQEYPRGSGEFRMIVDGGCIGSIDLKLWTPKKWNAYWKWHCDLQEGVLSPYVSPEE
jgi:hypothetical protein